MIERRTSLMVKPPPDGHESLLIGTLHQMCNMLKVQQCSISLTYANGACRTYSNGYTTQEFIALCKDNLEGAITKPDGDEITNFLPKGPQQ
jgi:hypothetical protein